MRLLILLIGCVLMTGPAYAQDDEPTFDPGADSATIAPLPFDRPVTDTISEAAIFDRWTFQLNEGDQIVITMTASDGLAPLVGITDASREVIAATNIGPEGDPLPPAEPDSTITLEYTAQRDGEHAAIATRAGNMDGTTTGSYTLTVTRVGSRLDALQPVEFRCGEDSLAQTVLTVDFTANQAMDAFRISAYGLDDFAPALNVLAAAGQVDDCSVDPQGMAGDTAHFTGEITRTYEADSPAAARYGLSGGAALGRVQMTLGTISAGTGPFMLVIQGFNLSSPGDVNAFEIRHGPAFVNTPFQVYMVKDGASRIDPVLQVIDAEETLLFACDDAGVRDCDVVPSADGIGVTFADETVVRGDRLSAGVTLAPGDVERQILRLRSRNPYALGDYAIIIIGDTTAP
jgi:hypothetical protein